MRFALIIAIAFSICAFGGQILSPQDVDIEPILKAKQLDTGDNPVISSDGFVQLWYGNLCGRPVMANIDDDVTLGVYVMTSSDAYVSDVLIVLATNTAYIETMYGASEATIYYPFTEWDFTWLSDPWVEPDGWQSQSFLGFPNIYPPYYGNPYLHSVVPIKVLDTKVHTVNDESLEGQLFDDALGTGIDPIQQIGSTFGDTLGMYPYPLYEHFSALKFRHHHGWGKGNFDTASLPEEFSLSQNYPNPFNATTTIDYALPQDSHITIRLYDILGNEVAVLLDQYQQAGYYSTTWDAGKVSSGMYFYRIETDGFTQTKKMMLLK